MILAKKNFHEYEHTPYKYGQYKFLVQPVVAAKQLLLADILPELNCTTCRHPHTSFPSALLQTTTIHAILSTTLLSHYQISKRLLGCTKSSPNIKKASTLILNLLYTPPYCTKLLRQYTVANIFCF